MEINGKYQLQVLRLRAAITIILHARVHEKLIHVGAVNNWLRSALEYAAMVYTSISKPAVERFCVGLAIDKASGKQLSFGGVRDLWMEYWQKCTEDQIRIAVDITLPVNIEEVIGIFTEKLKSWFKMD